MRLHTYLKGCLILFIVTSSYPQDGKRLIDQTLITNLNETPVYPYLTDTVNGQVKWKAEYQYLDEIDLYHITYISDSLKIKGYLVKPKQKGNYPCVIYNRGGNRNFGSLKIASAAITLGQIAKEGYVVIASQYRGNEGSEGQEEFGGQEVNDILILPEVLKEVEGANTRIIGMYGWSRGGMMTYIALTKTNQIKAAVVGGAVADNFETIKDRPEMETGVLAELVPNYETNKTAELEKRSAVKWVDKFPKNVPILMLHGNADWRVKPEQSLRMALQFETYRIPYRLIIFEGSDHGISEHRDEVNSQVIAWFDRYLKQNESLPNMEYHGR